MMCPAFKYEKNLEDHEAYMLERLLYEINGFDAMLREFLMVDVEFNLDSEKWQWVFEQRNVKQAVLRQLIAEVCEADFVSDYDIDFFAKKIRWCIEK